MALKDSARHLAHKSWRWDQLHWLGESQIMKATIAVPLLGYLILFNDNLVEHLALAEQFVSPQSSALRFLQSARERLADPASAKTLSHFRLYFLYFGGTLLALAQLVFLWRCPELVKRYRDAVGFVSAETRIMTPHRLLGMIDTVVRRIAAQSAHDFDVAPHLVSITLSPTQRSAEHQLVNVRVSFEYDTSDALIPNQRELNASLQEKVQTIFHPNWTTENVMTEWFVPLKSEQPFMRLAVSILYIAGFALLAIPAVDTLVSVTLTLMRES